MIKFKLMPALLLLIVSLLFLSTDTLEADMYKWVDDKGKTHFTDSPSKIPGKYIDKDKVGRLKSMPPAPKPLKIAKSPSSKHVDTCGDLPEKLEKCEKFQCNQSHPFMKSFIIHHLVEADKPGGCLYNQTMPNNMIMSCILSKELRIGVAQTIKQGGKQNSNSNQSVKSDLHNLFLGCNAFWQDTGNKNKCTLQDIKGPNIGFIQTSSYKISFFGDKDSFRAEVVDPNTKEKMWIDHRGNITGNVGKVDRNYLQEALNKKHCVIKKMNNKQK